MGNNRRRPASLMRQRWHRRFPALVAAFMFLAAFSALVLAASRATAADVTFRYVPPAGEQVTSVSLRGSFNSWGETPMAKSPDGSWSVTIQLAPGEYQYKFFINGQWPRDMAKGPDGRPIDPAADGYVDDGYGGQNAVRYVGGGSAQNQTVALGDGKIASGFLHHAPQDLSYSSLSPDGQWVVRANSAAGDVQRAELVYFPAGGPEASSAAQTAPMHVVATAGKIATWEARLPLPALPVKYYFQFQDGQATATLGQKEPAQEHPFEAGATQLNTQRFPLVRWTQGAVFYQVFPDRFADGDPRNDPANVTPWNGPVRRDTSGQYFGGDLKGLTDRLPYLAQLGVTALYLNPIFAAQSSHRYDTVDYMKIDPMLGTLDDFHAFLNAAHALGMRVILDGVFNHTGTGFWAFQDVLKNGARSPYAKWYYFKGFPVTMSPPNYEGWAGLASLPKLNLENPEVRDYILNVVRYWTAQGIDGWRLDVPNEIRAPGFWEEFRQTVKAIHPNAYIVGEIWQVAPEWLQGTRFDALMNYPIGYYALRPTFAGQAGWSLRRMDGEIHRVLASYADVADEMNFNLVDSHDTERILTALGGGNLGDTPAPAAITRLKLLTAIQFTLPGVPVIWNGDERGMLGEKGDNWDAQRAPIQWDQKDEGVFAYYQRLIALRKATPALWGADFTTLWLDDQGQTYAYQRGLGKDGVIVALNNGAETARIAVTPVGALAQALRAAVASTQVPPTADAASAPAAPAAAGPAGLVMRDLLTDQLVPATAGVDAGAGPPEPTAAEGSRQGAGASAPLASLSFLIPPGEAFILQLP
ncbi:MAG: alpha amylase N-terminal ig-like domain-containing protein [Firmicutes bacterium]|nr:alpha amylase N-terminal ig-like domain-containing protein [Bacillota bacterium]